MPASQRVQTGGVGSVHGGHCASQSSGDIASPIRLAVQRSGASNGWATASSDSGVSSTPISGSAQALASGDTHGNWPNQPASSGTDRMLTAPCACRWPDSQPGRCRRPLPASSKAPTRPNDSQKPGWVTAHGSASVTSASALSQILRAGQRDRSASASPQAASISSARCADTPKPASSA